MSGRVSGFKVAIAGGLASILLVACGPKVQPVPAGPVGQAIVEAAEAAHVPRDLLVAIANEEGGLRLAPRRMFVGEDHVPVAGYLELRHGAFDTLKRGGELVHVSEDALVEDTALATRAAALVLAELGDSDDHEDLFGWEPALRTLSGMADPTSARTYARRIMEALIAGGRFTAYGGEVVVLPAHPELVLPGVLDQAVSGTPDFPGAIWTETSCAGKCNIGRTAGLAIDSIIIHDTEGGWNASLATLQNDPGKSVHYLVDADGSRVAQFRPESDITWHCGNQNYNGRSVGIEHIGYAADPAGFSDALYTTSAQLVENIRTRHDVPLDRQHIIGHYQVPDGDVIAMTSVPCSAPLLSCMGNAKYGGASNHTDPGPRWQWCQYMQRLGGSCACNDTNAHLTCTTDGTQAVRCQNGVVEIRTCAETCQASGSGQDDLCSASRSEPQGNLVTARFKNHFAPLSGSNKTDSPKEIVTEDGASGCSMGGHVPPTAAVFFVLAMVVALSRRRRSY